MDEQLREDRRKAKIVIKELRDHQKELEEQKDEATNCRSDVLAKHFKKAEANMGKSSTIDQALLDAQIFCTLSKHTKKQAAQLQTGLQTYDVNSFMDNLVQFMRRSDGLSEGPEEEMHDVPDDELCINFIQLGESVKHCKKSVPAIDFMHGNAPVESVANVTERKKAKRIWKGKVTVKPDELRSDEVEQTETDRQVAEMKRELARRKECNYWIFVIDPASFSRSIENIFHSSFLIKERLAALDLKVDPPLIQYIDSKNRRHSGGGEGGMAEDRQSQFIMGFDRNVWKEMINQHNIRRCLLPSKRRADKGMDAQMQRLTQMEEHYEGTASF